MPSARIAQRNAAKQHAAVEQRKREAELRKRQEEQRVAAEQQKRKEEAELQSKQEGTGDKYPGQGGAVARYVHQAKLVGSSGIGHTYQGWSVAASADGNTAILGGPGDNFDNLGQGAAWVFIRAAGVWTQQGPKLVGSGAVGNARQGSSVALSADGNTAIVGGPWDSWSGAAWVFTRSGDFWTQQGSKPVGRTGRAEIDLKGHSVALSANGNIAIVGGPGDSASTGAARIFVRKSGVWSQLGEKLVGAGAVVLPSPFTGKPSKTSQGWSVALSADGNTAIVGGPFDSDGVGAAWVFQIEGYRRYR